MFSTILLSPVHFLNTCTYSDTIADNFRLDTNNRGLPFARKTSQNLNATGPSSAESYLFPHGPKSTSDYRHGGIPKRVESQENKYMQNGFFSKVLCFSPVIGIGISFSPSFTNLAYFRRNPCHKNH